MRPQTATKTGTGQSNVLSFDHKTTPFNIGFGCVVSGTVTYTVQHTFDGTNWFDHPVAAATTNRDGNYAYPVISVRINVTAGTGSVTMTAIQAGDGG